MPGFGKFGTKAAAPAAPAGPAAGGFKRAAPAAGARQAPQRTSRWAGVESSAGRDPILGAGSYLVEFQRHEITNNPGNGNETVRTKVTVLATDGECADPVGAERVILAIINGKSMHAGMARTKAMIVAQAGYDGDAEYDAFDPAGLLIDAALGAVNEMADLVMAGRRAYVQVGRGKPTADGLDYFREFSWSPCPDDEQEIPAPEVQRGTP
jgi:hypothetical protein